MTRHLLMALVCFLIIESGFSQSPSGSTPASEIKKTLPFKVLTSGKKVTIQSQKDIKNIIAWTSSGNRMVEQRNIDVRQYTFTVPPRENVVFVLLEMEDGSRYTHKIAIQ